jgi:multiple sugar transport system substrate-binding protein
MYKWMLVLSAILFVLVLGGCSSKVSSELQEEEHKDPVTLIVWSQQQDIPSVEMFQELYAKPVHAKYPYITLEMVQAKQSPLDKLVTQGEIPDMFIITLLNFKNIRDFGLLYDLTPLIEKYHFDMNRIQSGLIKQVQFTSDEGQINSIPHYLNFNALYYNKDIFDKFGVAYPRDGMNWDDTIELARKVTRTDGGVDYRGLDPENLDRLNYLGGNLGGLVDPKTDEPLVEEWRPAYELYERILSIPGNKLPKFNSSMDFFLKDKNVAMRLSYSQFDSLAKATDLNWDMVTYPVWKDRPNPRALAGGKGLMISNTSKHKDDAFLAIETLLSDDVQKEFMRNGQLSPLKDKAIQSEFGTKLPFLKGKNIKSVFTYEAGWYAPTQYDGFVAGIPKKHALDMYNGVKDINTVIREAKEEMTKIIQEKKRQ